MAEHSTAEAPNVAMVFAAGFGTRMTPLSDDRPKPLIKVADRALIDHALDLVAGAGARAVVNAHYKAPMLVQHVRDRAGRSPDTRVVIEQPDILDTGGGLRNALPQLGDGPVFTLNSDAIWAGANPLQVLARAWEPDRMGALLLLVSPENTVGYARVGNFAKGPDARLRRDEGGLVYTGAQVIDPQRLRHIKNDRFSLNVVWDELERADALFGVEYTGSWADVGTPPSIALAEEMLRSV